MLRRQDQIESSASSRTFIGGPGPLWPQVWSAFGPREDRKCRETMRVAERQNPSSEAISGDSPR